MSYRPDQQDWMAYLYNEMEPAERERMEHYLLSHPDARRELEQYQHLRQMMGSVSDKEVIAPPIVVGETRQRFLWNSPYLKTVISIAASLLIIMLAGRLTGIQMSLNNNEFRISFGSPQPSRDGVKQNEEVNPSLTSQEVQQMINASLNDNNLAMQASWNETQQKLGASIKKNLASTSGQINKLVSEASHASQEQIRQYVSNMQAENSQMMKNYFRLSSSEQKDYIEHLLVDFAKYLQQQRQDDLQLVQSRLNSIEENTDVFKQETEQILTSIIHTVGNPATETKY